MGDYFSFFKAPKYTADWYKQYGEIQRVGLRRADGSIYEADVPVLKIMLNELSTEERLTLLVLRGTMPARSPEEMQVYSDFQLSYDDAKRQAIFDAGILGLRDRGAVIETNERSLQTGKPLWEMHPYLNIITPLIEEDEHLALLNAQAAARGEAARWAKTRQ